MLLASRLRGLRGTQVEGGGKTKAGQPVGQPGGGIVPPLLFFKPFLRAFWV